MPQVTTSDQLIDLIRRSELVSPDELTRFLAEQSTGGGGQLPTNPDTLAEHFVASNLITQWQMEQLLRGKYRGFRLGKYTLKGHLGTGGMSSVYLSEHPIMRRPVAIKVLPKSRVAKSSYLERFELEARAVAALDHPNIVRAYDIDNEGDTHYIVMEYVEGRDLQRMVEQDGPLGYERAADYIAQAATGLQHAHEAGVVHRDIKPANCLVDKTGTVKVLDMGLAKFAEDEQSLSAIHKDNVVGTADYLAPEQAINSSRVDSRADIYGLGGTLYFLLTGHPPFPEGTLTERLLKHQKEEPRSIYATRPDAPAALVDICRRMMIKKADQRIQTAAEVADQLRQWLVSRGYIEPEKARASETGRLIPARAEREGEGRHDRWQHLARPAVLQPSTPAPPTGQTHPTARDDTRRLGREEEDLTLAPLDEEPAKREASGSKSGVRSGSVSDVHLDEQVLSRIEEEIGSRSSTSGSLVELLEDRHLTSVSTSGLKLRRPQDRPVWPWMLSAGAVLVVVALLLAVLLL